MGGTVGGRPTRWTRDWRSDVCTSDLWSARTRLEDFRLESVALANTLASLLMREAPTGNPESLAQGVAGWSRHRLTESQDTVYVVHRGVLSRSEERRVGNGWNCRGTADEMDA